MASVRIAIDDNYTPVWGEMLGQETTGLATTVSTAKNSDGLHLCSRTINALCDRNLGESRRAHDRKRTEKQKQCREGQTDVEDHSRNAQNKWVRRIQESTFLSDNPFRSRPVAMWSDVFDSALAIRHFCDCPTLKEVHSWK
jgi:hypothetical protein